LAALALQRYEISVDYKRLSFQLFSKSSQARARNRMKKARRLEVKKKANPKAGSFDYSR